MSQQVGIVFPNSIKEWHLYSPEVEKDSGSTAMVSLLNKADIIKYQNQLQKFLYVWKKKFEKIFPMTFIIDSFNLHQVSYLDYNSKNTNYVIFQIKSPDLFFSVQIDSIFAKMLLKQSFGIEDINLIDLAYTDLEQIVFQQFFKDTFMPALVENSVLSRFSEFETEYGKKEKNGLIHSTDAYYVFKYHLLFSSYVEPCHILFTFTKENMEKFFNKISFQHKFNQIYISPMIQQEMFTKVEVKFGEAHLTLGELQSIQSGDVLLLKKKIGDPVNAVIGDELSFMADCGLYKNSIAIKLLKQIIIDNESIVSIPPQLEVEEGDDELMEEFSKGIKEDALNEFKSILEDNPEEEEEKFDWESL